MSVSLLSLVADEHVGEGSAELADAVADLAQPSRGMSTVDCLTRWIGHAGDWSSDEMGAAASVVLLTDSERVLYAIAGALDWQVARDYDASVLASLRGGPALPPLVVACSADDLPAPWSFVRSDDRGFWDAVFCDTEDEARELLAAWERVNLPPVCDDCGESFGADDGERSELGTFCPDCWRTRGEDAAAADALRDYGLQVGDRVYRTTDAEDERVTFVIVGWVDCGDALLSYGDHVGYWSADPADLVKVGRSGSVFADELRDAETMGSAFGPAE